MAHGEEISLVDNKDNLLLSDLEPVFKAIRTAITVSKQRFAIADSGWQYGITTNSFKTAGGKIVVRTNDLELRYSYDKSRHLNSLVFARKIFQLSSAQVAYQTPDKLCPKPAFAVFDWKGAETEHEVAIIEDAHLTQRQFQFSYAVYDSLVNAVILHSQEPVRQVNE